jgi:hypothetical protein
MKFRSKLTIVLLIGVVLFYIACKKMDSPGAQSQTTTGADMVSKQIALNLHKSLYGLYGGGKIKKPSFVNTYAAAVPNPACGFTIDSVLNYNTTASDTVSHTTGRIILIFNCTNGQPSGYSAIDTINTTGTATGFSFVNNSVQNYAITSLNPTNTQLSVNGSIVAFVGVTYASPATKPTIDSATYTLTGLTINVSNNYDVTAGTATFVTTGSYNNGPWNYTGTITFLGNHMANITINGKVYPVTF